MRTQPIDIPGPLLIEPEIFADERGYNVENYRMGPGGLPFVQTNTSLSRRGVIRGLHYLTKPQGKLVRCVHGTIFDVVVDLRTRRWASVTLGGGYAGALWIPAGFAHGFQTISTESVVVYEFTSTYEKACDRAIRWNDPQLGINWPLDNPILSKRDSIAPLLKDAA